MNQLPLVFTRYPLFEGAVIKLDTVAGIELSGFYRVVSVLPRSKARIADMESGEIQLIEYELPSTNTH